MSQLEAVKVYDKRMMVFNKRKYGAFVGPKSFIWQNFASTSFSTSSANVTVNCPNGCITYNRLNQTLRCRLTINGTAGAVSPNMVSVDSNGVPNGYFAPRSFPIANATNNVQVSLNNLQLNERVNSYVEAIFPHYQTRDDLEKSDLAGTPVYGDNAQDYTLTDNTSINVLAPVYDNPYFDTRGGFPMTIISNSPTQAVVEFEFNEPIFCSPFSYGDNMSYSGITQLDQVQINVNFDSNLVARMFSFSTAGNTISSTSIQFLSYSVQAGFLQPPMEIRNQLPSELYLPYYNTVPYTTSVPSLAPNGASSVTSNVLEFAVIPNKLYVWLEVQNVDKTIYTSDAYARITGANIVFNGVSGILSSDTEENLWLRSVDNGSDKTFREWKADKGYGSGSVLCLQFGKDIPLAEENLAPGCTYKTNMQITLNVTNPDPINSKIYQMQILQCNEGTICLRDRNAFASIGELTPESVAMASPSNLVQERSKTMLGGFSFSDIFNGIGSVLKPIVDVGRSLVEAGVPQALFPSSGNTLNNLADASRAARNVGYGNNGVSDYEQSFYRGRGVIGGRRMQKNKLHY